ncbi:MAG: hypothetical protein FJ202_09725 [Gemmatimonadetes bacterium]|nr:hypothetical protein [Gemmatimonadota bacterium]
MIRNHRVLLTAVAAVTLVSACDTVTSSGGGSPIGVGGIAARAKGTGFTTAPQIAFYRVSSANFVSAAGVRDTCFDAAYSASATTGSITAAALSAGSAVLLTIGNRTDTLVRIAGGLDPTYRSSLTAGIPYTPGDSMVITIPGDRNGFPASTFRGKTAEAFTIADIQPPASGQPINATWTPSSDANSAMFITLRYVAGTTATTFNRQVACSFVDDGSGLISASVASAWSAATTRDFTAQRVRTILAQVEVPLSYLNVVSTFDRPTPVSP